MFGEGVAQRRGKSIRPKRQYFQSSKYGEGGYTFLGLLQNVDAH